MLCHVSPSYEARCSSEDVCKYTYSTSKMAVLEPLLQGPSGGQDGWAAGEELTLSWLNSSSLNADATLRSAPASAFTVEHAPDERAVGELTPRYTPLCKTLSVVDNSGKACSSSCSGLLCELNAHAAGKFSIRVRWGANGFVRHTGGINPTGEDEMLVFRALVETITLPLVRLRVARCCVDHSWFSFTPLRLLRTCNSRSMS